jgi:peptide/nickel transport system permease protein
MTVLRTLVRTRTGLAGLVLVGLLVLSALISLVWTPYDPTLVRPAEGWLLPFSGGHLLGTDRLGRDELSQLLAGARSTFWTALLAAGIAAAAGLALALAAVLTPRWIGASVVQLTDVLIAFPVLLLAMILTAAFGGSTWTAVTAIGIGAGVNVARVARAEAARVLGTDYVLAAHAAGSGTWRTVRKHLLPNIAPTLIVQLSLVLSVAVLAVAALSYLGFGTPPPTVSWGRMLQEQQSYITARPLLVIWPGIAVACSVLGFNLLGDALREATDPRLRHGGPAARVGGGQTGALPGPGPEAHPRSSYGAPERTARPGEVPTSAKRGGRDPRPGPQPGPADDGSAGPLPAADAQPAAPQTRDPRSGARRPNTPDPAAGDRDTPTTDAEPPAEVTP